MKRTLDDLYTAEMNASPGKTPMEGEGRGDGVPGYGLNGQLKVRAGVEDHLLIVFSVLHFFFFVSFLL